MLPLERWITLWPGQANGLRRQTFTDLDARYREPHRAYHTWSHIEFCLSLFDGFRSLTRHPIHVELAIWYHDAIYIPGNLNNEIESARLFQHQSERLGLSPRDRNEVSELIVGTSHDREQRETGQSMSHLTDVNLVNDIDLAILGLSRERYQLYADSIRTEFAHIDRELFDERRAALLRSFLGRRRIYRIPEISSVYEANARSNLRAEIESLTTS